MIRTTSSIVIWIWAIGTGLTPTLEDVGSMHAIIRAMLGEVYGERAPYFAFSTAGR